MRQSTAKTSKHQSGSAALEAMMLIPLIVVILMLIINMGYNGIRHRKTQNALRLGAFEYVDGLATTDKANALSQAKGSIKQKVFDGETDPLSIGASGQNQDPTVTLPDNDGILADVSHRQAMAVTVKRAPPYDILPATPIKASLIVAANTFTYCEMKDEDFDSVGQDAMDGFMLFGDYALWLFGGCGGGTDAIARCSDRCGP